MSHYLKKEENGVPSFPSSLGMFACKFMWLWLWLPQHEQG